jgi:hypothetical protein
VVGGSNSRKKKWTCEGYIAQAKNGGELFWEEKFHAANGKAQAHTQGALHFFLLSLGGGLEEDIFQFSWVPTMFPSRFQ